MHTLIVLISLVSGQIPFDSPHWKVDAREHERVKWMGKSAIRMVNGITWLDHIDFTDGTIEFQLNLSGERGFVGGIWRLQDRGNYEEFYVRPHQSGNPDANQYTPVFNGLAGWQLFHGPGYGAPVKYPIGKWFPVKIVVSGNQAEIYVEDMSKPALFVPRLHHDTKAGKVGISAGPRAPAHIADFKVIPQKAPALMGSAPKMKPAPEGVITQWKVSDPFDSNLLSGTAPLDKQMVAERTWQTLAAEPSGITNLARLHGPSRGADTVFARLDVSSDEAKTMALKLGYSDRIKVYVNGQPIYAGTNRYRTRDYRYLGTIGIFDEVYLPLKAGDNEILLAVSEAFGGWGIIGAR